MTSSLSQTWLGPRLLLLCLLVSRSITKEESKHCSYMIGDGHLQLLQQLVSVWTDLPYLLPTGETEVGAKEQGQSEGWRQRNRAVQNMACGPHLAPLILPSLTFSRSGPLIPAPTVKPSLTSLLAGGRVGFQLVAWVNDCLECQSQTLKRLVRPAVCPSVGCFL